MHLILLEYAEYSRNVYEVGKVYQINQFYELVFGRRVSGIYIFWLR